VINKEAQGCWGCLVEDAGELRLLEPANGLLTPPRLLALLHTSPVLLDKLAEHCLGRDL